MASEATKDHQILSFNDESRCNIHLRRLSKIRSGINLVCIDTSSSLLSSMNNEERIRLTDAYSHCNILRYNSLSKCLKYLKQARPYERIIVLLVINEFDIINKGISNIDIDRINQYQQVQSILIIYRSNKTNRNDKIHLFTDVKNKIDKLVGIYKDYQSASLHLQKLIGEVEELDDGSLLTFNKRDKSLKDVRQNFIEYLSIYLYRVILVAMSYKSLEAKRQMLDEIRAYYRGKSKPSGDIDRFSRSYNSSDAINWYTRSSFLYHIVNRALRTEDVRALYIFRYFIVDLSVCLNEMAVATRALHNTPFHCYRGSIMSREEIKQLHADMLVVTNTFWSSSRDVSVAKTFAGIDLTTGMSPSRSRKDKRQHALFEIDIDFTRSPKLIVADVSHLSAYKEENEMLFDMGTPLSITKKRYDKKHRVWHILMTSTSEIDTLNRDNTSHIHQRLLHTNGLILYGNLLTGISCDFKEAVTYFQRLLRVLPTNDENRPNIYCELGRAYRFMSKYPQAIEYYCVALLLQRRSLPQSKFDYGYTLSGLAVVYSETGDSVRAIRFSTRALDIYHTLFPDDHLEITQIRNRLAYDLYRNSQYQEASDLLSKMDTLIKRKTFLTSPQAQLYHTLGLLHKTCGNRTEALEYLKQALELREKWSHKHHPDTARICYELSLWYAEENDQQALALKYAKRALHIRQTTISSNKIELEESIELVKRLSQSNDST